MFVPNRVEARSAPAPRLWPPAYLSLALQGGGSFGAFTWGVLDRLLEEPSLRLDLISGASAGAVNAALLASGMIEGGRDGARLRLERFWRDISRRTGAMRLGTFNASGLGLVARMLAPHQFNPFDLNPLREALLAEIDFERLARQSKIRLMIATTRVSDGRLRLFRNVEMSIDVILASSCLPTLHRTVEIGGEAYWDGGYAANPPLVPLAHETDALDVLVVQLTPSHNERRPKSVEDISKRLDQISFNATLNTQLEALALGAEVAASPKLRDLRIACIAAEDTFADLLNASASDLDWTFLTRLRDSGRAAASHWLTREDAAREKIAH